MGLGAGSGLLLEAKGTSKEGFEISLHVLEIMGWLLVDLDSLYMYNILHFTLEFGSTNFSIQKLKTIDLNLKIQL